MVDLVHRPVKGQERIAELGTSYRRRYAMNSRRWRFASIIASERGSRP
jgi:hypothetical protein